jgi:L-threonylcarbamoyladenylate synthase
MRRVVVDPIRPDPAAIAYAAEVIRRGGILAFPTDTLYGLAADPFNRSAVRRVFAVKDRPADRPLLLVAADVEQVEAQLAELSDAARTLARRFWPGPLTLLVSPPPSLPTEVVGSSGRVGVRVPAHAVARALCASCRTVVTATSANPSGGPASSDPDEVALALGASIDLLLDAGITPGGAPSTVVDIVGKPALVRAGAVPWDAVHACLETITR